jgi:RHS repeat-associated protein
VTTTKYNLRFQTTEVKDALNQTYTFGYDAMGRLLSQTRAGGSMSFVYDEVGNQTKRTDYAGRVTNYIYDNLNRLEKIEYDNGSGGLITKQISTYGYDDLSRLTSAGNDNGTVSFVYDNRDRLTSTTDVFGQAIVYEYDRTSSVNQKRLKLNGSLYATYNFDDAERLTNIVNAADSSTITFGYDTEDKLTSRVYPNGVTTSYEYFDDDSLKRLKDLTSSATLFDRQYTYNSARQIASIAEASGTRTFGYDLVDRLTSVTGPAGESYSYDDVGNRTSSHISATYGYQTGHFNQLSTTATAAYSYDANGNMSIKAEGSDMWRFGWDHENRVVTAATRRNSVRYKYDALGRRIERNFGFGREHTKYTYDGPDTLVEDNKGTITKYINGSGIDSKLSARTGATSLYFLSDHLGSTNGLADSTGALTSQTAYDSFGNPISNLATAYQFTGREYDSFSGFYYYRARFYDPKIGRFISEDPIGFSGGDINIYIYTHSNPINKTDPYGLIDPIVNQSPNIYPQTGYEASCILGDLNPWIGLEFGGGFHLIYTGLGGSGGADINPLTGEANLYLKGTARFGFGLFAGFGPKLNIGFGPRTRENGVYQSAEPSMDVAFGEGARVNLKDGAFVRTPAYNMGGSGSVSNSGLGIGLGFYNLGFGASVGVDAGEKKVWSFNRPTQECSCQSKR